jgi:hypothetical protein
MLIDSVRYLFGSRVVAFAVVFSIEAMLFLVAARVMRKRAGATPDETGTWRAVSA